VVENSISTVLVERQLAIVVEDLAAHIINNESKQKPQEGETVWGKASLEYQPYGVSLILSGSLDPLCDAVAPFASSIAAGNVVILATIGSKNNSLLSILQRELPIYMDTFSIHIVADVDLEHLHADDAHHITIFGMSYMFRPTFDVNC
jgi:hypothetical protein